jgi:PhoPQ-activated pathogenicity-related protein
MKNALIDPSVSVRHVVSWKDTEPKQPVYETYANSARVAEVTQTEFEVSPPLFWTVCEDTILPDRWYYNTTNNTFNPVVNAPMPPTI